MPNILSNKAIRAFKDQYLLDYVNVEDADEEIDEKILDQGIVQNIKKFLMALGNDFTFMGNQYRLIVSEEEYFIDLLFFNLKLNCYVVFELKAREFAPQDIGQIKWYMELVNKEVKEQNHNTTIGIILCKNKDRLMVEYMLSNSQDPLGVATFNRYEELPEKYAKYLPSEEEIIKRLGNLDLN